MELARQKCRGGAESVLQEIREYVRTTGRLVKEEFDHAHPAKNGLSNKRIQLAARDLLGTGEIPDYPEAYMICVRAAFG